MIIILTRGAWMYILHACGNTLRRILQLKFSTSTEEDINLSAEKKLAIKVMASRVA
jgi:hypothetical protein